MPQKTTHPVGGYDETMVGEFSKYAGTYVWDIVGEAHYQDALSEMCGGPNETGHEKQVWALVVLETGNPHDENAVAIHIDTGLVGYLPRVFAKNYRAALERMKLGSYAMRVPAIVVGGWRRGRDDVGDFGLKLDLPGEPE